MEHYNTLVESSKKQFEEHEKCLGLFSVSNEERDKKIKESEKLIKNLKLKEKELKENLFSNVLITYIPVKDYTNEQYGKLVENVCFDNLMYLFIIIILECNFRKSKVKKNFQEKLKTNLNCILQIKINHYIQ